MYHKRLAVAECPICHCEEHSDAAISTTLQAVDRRAPLAMTSAYLVDVLPD